MIEIHPVSVPTFQATIYVGLLDLLKGTELPYEKVHEFLQEYVDGVGLCVTLTETKFIYTTGWEHGFAIGLINYPRFPSTPAAIKEHALEIAKRLMVLCRQARVSIVMSDETIMLLDTDRNAQHKR